jgi:hypothetical protein
MRKLCPPTQAQACRKSMEIEGIVKNTILSYCGLAAAGGNRNDTVASDVIGNNDNEPAFADETARYVRVQTLEC